MIIITFWTINFFISTLIRSSTRPVLSLFIDQLAGGCECGQGSLETAGTQNTPWMTKSSLIKSYLYRIEHFPTIWISCQNSFEKTNEKPGPEFSSFCVNEFVISRYCCNYWVSNLLYQVLSACLLGKIKKSKSQSGNSTFL